MIFLCRNAPAKNATSCKLHARSLRKPSAKIAEDLRRSTRRSQALLSRNVHRLRHEDCQRESRPQARQYKFCGEAKPLDENEHSPFHPSHKCILKEGRESCRSGCSPFHVLQFLSRAPDIARDSGNGSGLGAPRMVHYRIGNAARKQGLTVNSCLTCGRHLGNLASQLVVSYHCV